MILELVHNSALLLALTVAYEYIAGNFRRPSSGYRLLSGLLFGAAAVAVMAAPVYVATGVMYDARSIVLAVAGYFGGPVAAAGASLLAGAYRVWVGGAGMVAGLLIIVEAAGLGVAAHLLRARDSRWEQTPRILGLGIVVHVVMMLSQMILPEPVRREVMMRVAPPVLIVYPFMFLLIVRIILERERGREQVEELYLLRYSTEHSIVAMFRITEPEGRIVYANRAACESLGYTKEEVTGLTVFDIDPTFTRERWLEHRRHLREEGGRTIETVHRRKDGTEFPVEVTVSPIVYGGERFSFSFARDISRRKEVEEELRASLAQKEVLLREIHHRVKNNLAVMSGLLRLQLADARLEEASVRALSKTRDRIDVMGTIHNMLYSEGDLARIDFSAVLERIASGLYDEYDEGRGIALSIQAEPIELEVGQALPLGLIANEAITNALLHAFPATGGCEAAPRPEVTVGLSEESGGGYRLSVRDTGSGLPEGFALEEQETLGFQMIGSLAQQVQARVEVGSQDGAYVEVFFEP
ncbi:MAG: sensor histidine kinase [Spirochaetaceae bacterium]